MSGLNRIRLVFALITGSLTAGLQACTSDVLRPVVPRGVSMNAIAGGSDTTSDNCVQEDPNPNIYLPNTCHDGPISYVGDLDESCPQGCYSYPLDPEMVEQFDLAVNLIENDLIYAEDPQACRDVLTFMKHQRLNGYIRKISTETMTADSHGAQPPGTGADWRGSIHIDRDFAMADPQDFADTIMHEGYHAYMNAADRYKTSEEQRADSFAVGCTTMPSG